MITTCFEFKKYLWLTCSYVNYKTSFEDSAISLQKGIFMFDDLLNGSQKFPTTVTISIWQLNNKTLVFKKYFPHNKFTSHVLRTNKINGHVYFVMIPILKYSQKEIVTKILRPISKMLQYEKKSVYVFSHNVLSSKQQSFLFSQLCNNNRVFTRFPFNVKDFIQAFQFELYSKNAIDLLVEKILVKVVPNNNNEDRQTVKQIFTNSEKNFKSKNEQINLYKWFLFDDLKHSKIHEFIQKKNSLL